MRLASQLSPLSMRRFNAAANRVSHAAAMCLAAAALCAVPAAAQEPALAWDAVQYFQYNIQRINYNSTARSVTVVFSVTNPKASNAPYDILDRSVATFTPPGATLRVDVGWNTPGWQTTELVNTGSLPGGETLVPITRTWMNFVPPNPGGVGASYPNVLNALTGAKRCSTLNSPCGGVPNPNLTFYVSTVLPKQAAGAGRIAIEGHPVKQTGVDATGAAIFANIPVKSVYADFAIDSTGVPRRQIVEIAKCKVCHDGGQHGDTVVPRLSLHGGNRTEEPGVCVVCHNPNQTDVAYRSSGQEQSVDFKRLVHGIHAGGMRKSPLIIVGFRGSVNDFSGVRFPAELRNCVLCHIDKNGKGTFELPLSTTLGSTITTASVLSPLPGTVDVNPANDLKISPIAAACSACHDDRETRDHMISKGASFGALQSVLAGKELCNACHGPGKERDVRRVHLSSDD